MVNEYWGNMAAMDVQTTYNLRQVTGVIGVSYDYINAYEGGRSLRFTVNQNGDVPVYGLFDTSFKLDNDLVLSIVCCTDGGITPYIIISDSERAWYLEPSECICNQNWSRVNYKIPADPGKLMTGINLELKGGEIGDTINIGQVSINPAARKDTPSPITGLDTINTEWFIDDYYRVYADTTLSWDYSPDHRYYDIYIKKPDYGDFRWYRRAYTNGYRATGLVIKADVLWTKTDIVFAVVPVDNGGIYDTTFNYTTTFSWEPPESYLSGTPREVNQ